jgi:hypothetical protein
LTAVAAYGLPDLVTKPAAASSVVISRKDRFPPFARLLAIFFASATVSGLFSAMAFLALYLRA